MGVHETLTGAQRTARYSAAKRSKARQGVETQGQDK